MNLDWNVLLQEDNHPPPVMVIGDLHLQNMSDGDLGDKIRRAKIMLDEKSSRSKFSDGGARLEARLKALMAEWERRRDLLKADAKCKNPTPLADMSPCPDVTDDIASHGVPSLNLDFDLASFLRKYDEENPINFSRPTSHHCDFKTKNESFMATKSQKIALSSRQASFKSPNHISGHTNDPPQPNHEQSRSHSSPSPHQSDQYDSAHFEKHYLQKPTSPSTSNSDDAPLSSSMGQPNIKDATTHENVVSNDSSGPKDNPSPAKGLSLLGFKPHDADGDLAIIKETDLLNVEEKWGFGLVGYFTDEFPGVTAVNTLCASWKVPCKFHSHESGWLVFKFSNTEDRELVLSSGPHVIDGSALLLKIMPNFFEFSSEFSIMPLWINLPGLPLEMWSAEALAQIGMKIGRPISMDVFTNSMERIDFARIFVEVDLAKDLVNMVKIQLPSGRVIHQKIVYEVLPNFCTMCRKFGHTLANCGAEKTANPSGSKPNTKDRETFSHKDPCPSTSKSKRHKKTKENEALLILSSACHKASENENLTIGEYTCHPEPMEINGNW